LDQQQWAELQQHLEEAAAADAAAAAAALADQRQSGGSEAGGQQQQEGQASGRTLSKGGSFGIPGSARHTRGQIVHHRTGSIAASMRVGHIPAGSTDAGGLHARHSTAVCSAACLHGSVRHQQSAAGLVGQAEAA